MCEIGMRHTDSTRTRISTMDEYGNVFSYDLQMGPILIICKAFYLETTVKQEEKGIFVDPINSALNFNFVTKRPLV